MNKDAFDNNPHVTLPQMSHEQLVSLMKDFKRVMSLIADSKAEFKLPKIRLSENMNLNLISQNTKTNTFQIKAENKQQLTLIELLIQAKNTACNNSVNLSSLLYCYIKALNVPGNHRVTVQKALKDGDLWLKKYSEDVKRSKTQGNNKKRNPKITPAELQEITSQWEKLFNPEVVKQPSLTPIQRLELEFEAKSKELESSETKEKNEELIYGMSG